MQFSFTLSRVCNLSLTLRNARLIISLSTETANKKGNHIGTRHPFIREQTEKEHQLIAAQSTMQKELFYVWLIFPSASNTSIVSTIFYAIAGSHFLWLQGQKQKPSSKI